MAVNVVFHVPGPLHKPRFNGMRTGTVAVERRALVVQVAVPEETVACQPPDYLLASLRKALSLAESYVQRALSNGISVRCGRR